MSTRKFNLVVWCVAAGCSAGVYAQAPTATVYNWNVLGGGNQLWQVAGNWSPATVPNSALSAANLSVALTSNLNVDLGASDITIAALNLGGTGAAVATNVTATTPGTDLILQNDDATLNTGNVWITSSGAAGTTNTISAPIISNNERVEFAATGTTDVTLTQAFGFNNTGASIRNLMPAARKVTMSGGINLVDPVTTLATSFGINDSSTSTGTIEITGVITTAGATGNVANVSLNFGTTSGSAPLSTIILSADNTYNIRTTQNRSNLVLAHNNALGVDSVLGNFSSGGANYRQGNPSGGFGFNLISTNDARVISVDADFAQFASVKGEHSLEWAGTVINGNARGWVNMLPQGKVLTLSGAQYAVRPADSTQIRINAFDGTGRTNLTGGLHDTGGTTTTPTGTERGELRKTGSGVLYVTGGNSTYTGRTLVDGGNLHFGAEADFDSTSKLTASGNGPIVSSGGAIGVDTGTSTNALFISKIDIASTGGLMLTPGESAASLDFTGTLANAAGMSIAAPETGLSYTGTITPANNAYRLGGGAGTLTLPQLNQLTGARSVTAINGGTVVLSNNNNYTGATILQGEYMETNELRAAADTNTNIANQVLVGTTLSVNKLANGGAASSIGTSSNAASNLIIHGSTLKYTGAGDNTNRQMTIGTGGATLDASGTGALNFTSTAAATLDEAENRAANLDAFDNNNRTILNVADTSDILVGMPVSGLAAIPTTPATTIVAVINGTQLRLSAGVPADTIQSGTAVFGPLARTLTLTGSNTGANTLAAQIPNAGAAVGITKTGTGRWVLSGANAYAGPTDVQAGTLLINGVQTGTGATTIAAGATLGGSGTLGAGLTANGVVSPGASAGTLAVNGDATFNAGSTLLIELGGTGAGQFDKLVLGGTGVLTAGGTFDVDLIGGFNPASGNSFDVLDFVSATGSFTLNLPALGAGLSWNTTNLLTTGVLAVTGAAASDADFDADGDVDGADFLTWQRNVGTNSGAGLSQGDADGNGAVNNADLTVWKGQYGSATVAAGSVPEPAGIALAMLAIAGATALVRRNRVH